MKMTCAVSHIAYSCLLFKCDYMLGKGKKKKKTLTKLPVKNPHSKVSTLTTMEGKDHQEFLSTASKLIVMPRYGSVTRN